MAAIQQPCTCGPDVRCVECGGCDCPDNAGVCDGPGCLSIEAYDQWADEAGWSRTSYG